jgi:hypothetical protein
MAFAATALEVYGALKKGQAQRQALDYNSAVMANEQKSALAQGVTQEDIVRRNSREALGRQAAAFGAAGVGYGGSSKVALDTSAVNQELDALNTRYRAVMTGYGYGAQSSIDQYEADQAGANSELLAGAALLKGLGPYYTTTSGLTGQTARQKYATPNGT